MSSPCFAALDAAIQAWRANPSPETRAAMMAAAEARVVAFHAEQTAEFQGRTAARSAR
jgi:hypothetical protein